ncbi:hypothetical protein M23134_07953 [Microscilla marina ATCC 23134]|uniref:DUF6089 domain-containing protein n=2 Tax=Microscilla marina TaxID=1027 RepID=A1ZWH6_MICM2|nr:hypothetical protein M23134_07953 [Microscilla marina ATCC 23134]
MMKLMQKLWILVWCTMISITTTYGQTIGLHPVSQTSASLSSYPVYGMYAHQSLDQESAKALLNKPFRPHFSIGISTGFMHYKGDVYSKLKVGPGLSYGASLYLHFTPWLKARASVAIGSISGNDSESADLDQQAQNLNFRNRIQELSLLAEWDFFPWLPEKPSKFAAFIFTGFTFFKHNPQSFNAFSVTYLNLRNLHTEGQVPSNYSLTSTAIPIGIGGRYRFAKRWTVSLQAGIRFTLTDYIDDVGKGAYPSADALPNALSIQYANRSMESRPGLDQLIASRGVVTYTDSDGSVYTTLKGFEPGTSRGRVAGNDRYFLFQLTISTYFGKIPRLLPN